MTIIGTSLRDAVREHRAACLAMIDAIDRSDASTAASVGEVRAVLVGIVAQCAALDDVARAVEGIKARLLADDDIHRLLAAASTVGNVRMQHVALAAFNGDRGARAEVYDRTRTATVDMREA